MSPTSHPHTTKLLPSYAAVSKVVNKYRAQHKTIVLTQGSYDMIHIGHGRYLQCAKDRGDVLIVGVDSDIKVRQRKGPDRPVVPQDERLEMLCFLSSVDHVVLKPHNAPRWDLIKIIKPDILVATTDTYSKSELKELKEWCGQVKVYEPQATTSTSAKLRRLQIGFAKDFTDKLTPKIEKAIDQVIKELES